MLPISRSLPSAPLASLASGQSSGQSLLASAHWPLATSATSSQSSRAHWDQNPYCHRSLNSHLCHHTGQSLQQTLLANLLATDIESTQEHCIVFLLVQTLYLTLSRLLWPQDRKQRGMASELLGARKTTLVFSPCTSTSTYIGLLHCQLFAPALLPAQIASKEMMKCLTVRI